MDFILENIDSILTVVYCFLVGIIVAFVISLFTKGIYGKLVDALVRHGADSPDTAKDLKELGVKNNPLLDNALRRRTTLSSLVSCANSDSDVSERKYYILPQHRIKAQAIYGRDKLSPISTVIALVVFVAVLLLINYAVPKFIS